MRDLLVVTIVFAGSIYALKQPWTGIMVWTWVSIMNPHSLAYGFSRDFPVAAIAAVATLMGIIKATERRSPFVDSPPVWLAIFMLWICIGYPFSYSVDGSTQMLSKVLKIDLMILATLMVILSRKHIDVFVWVIVLSLGLLGAKAGIFTIKSGGNFRVFGPGGFIEGNNEFALALIVSIPLMRYLQLQASNKWVRRGLLAMMLLTAVAALGSHSRGALLAIAAMALFLWLKSPQKLSLGIGLVIAGIAMVAFMPESWTARMNTIETYEQDASAMGRINAWEAAFNVARDRITGAGFDMYTREIFALYAPVPNDVHAAHSIYFQVLGEHGFIGLIIFMGIWVSVWRTASKVIAMSGKSPDHQWCKQLAAMCQVSLIGYAVGGAFLSLAYFDLPYNMLVIVVALRQWLLQRPAPTVGRPPTNGVLAPTGVTFSRKD